MQRLKMTREPIAAAEDKPGKKYKTAEVSLPIPPREKHGEPVLQHCIVCEHTISGEKSGLHFEGNHFARKVDKRRYLANSDTLSIFSVVLENFHLKLTFLIFTYTSPTFSSPK